MKRVFATIAHHISHVTSLSLLLIYLPYWIPFGGMASQIVFSRFLGVEIAVSLHMAVKVRSSADRIYLRLGDDF